MQEVARLCIAVLATFIFVYSWGNYARQQPVVDDALRLLEGGFESISTKLKDLSIRSGLRWLGRAYGWAALVCFAFMLVFGRLFTPTLALVTDSTFLLTLFACFSIKWWIDHSQVLQIFGSVVAISVLCPILIAGSDLLMGTKIFFPYFNMFFHMPLPFGIHITSTANPLGPALVLAGIFFLNFASAYISTWFVTGIVVIASLFAVAGSVNLAKSIHWVNPKAPFVAFVILIGAILTFIGYF